MNFRTPLSALFPGTSGRLLTALVDHHATGAARPLTLDELSKDAAVTSSQSEAALFRLGLLGLIVPRRKGEVVRLVAGHIVWTALGQLTDLRGRVIDAVREQALGHLHPAPDYLALSGAVIEGTAAHPADVLELIVVPPAIAPADWRNGVAALVTQLSLDLGNVVVHRSAHDAQVAEAMGWKERRTRLPTVMARGSLSGFGSPTFSSVGSGHPPYQVHSGGQETRGGDLVLVAQVVHGLEVHESEHRTALTDACVRGTRVVPRNTSPVPSASAPHRSLAVMRYRPDVNRQT